MAKKRLRTQQKGHLYKDGHYWRVRWWEEGLGGRKRHPSAVVGRCDGPGAISRKTAQRLADEGPLQMSSVWAQCPSSVITFEQFILDRFRSEAMRRMKPAGQKHYDSMFKLILPDLGSKSLRDITVQDINTLINKMAEPNAIKAVPPVLNSNGKVIRPGRPARAYSTQSRVHVKNAISGVITYAKEVGAYTGENPCSLVRSHAVVHGKRSSLNWEQAKQVLDALPLNIRTMAFLGMTTSLGAAELCGLRWGRVNITATAKIIDEEVVPPFSLLVVENYYLGKYGNCKTGNRDRIVPIPATVAGMIAELRCRPRFTGPDDPVFASRTGKPIIANNVQKRIFGKIGKSLGIKIGWHTFRRTASTMTMLEGMSTADRVAMMGHGGSEMTDYYAASDVERRRGTIDQMAAKIMPSVAETETVQ